MRQERILKFCARSAVLLLAATFICHPLAGMTTEPPPPRPRIAVLDFESPGLENLGWQLAEMLRSAIVLTGRFDVVERARLDDLLKQKALAEAGVVAPGTLADFGSYADAQTVVVGSVSKLGESYYINARVVDVATGIALDAKRLKSPDVDGLVDQADLLAYLIAGEDNASSPVALAASIPEEAQPVGDVQYKFLDFPDNEPQPTRPGVIVFSSDTGNLGYNVLDQAIRDRFESSACCRLVPVEDMLANLPPEPEWNNVEALSAAILAANARYAISSIATPGEDGFTVSIMVLDADTGETFSPMDITGDADKLQSASGAIAEQVYRFLSGLMKL